MKIFVLNGHKYYPFAEGKLNKTLFDKIVEIVSKNNEVKTTIVEQGYDIDEEIEKFQWADVIIFQTPMNWFSVPWILKKYFDEVYRYGAFYAASEAYGEGGLMKGKKYMYSITCNISEKDFEKPNTFFDGKQIEDIILPLHKLQQFCGMTPVKAFFAFDVVHNPDVPKYLEELEAHISANILV
ncbi:MAG: NAD(P)H-dependent oxidoreductase [Candidatus Gastranaerophilales bacterium]|nr:NAD(P)H-dependent oxidoreductase [Candidatus Gastranaerophilales bacterium]